ncbi:TetR/AcrR family transcriptional regulator [Actinokineospora sp. G85]|uniref:TetR/AcrR family transcriptional regulator n=1 Tax=Actinokineospora sp. G85 TaxID=3406626 RepID=UPI003C7530EE
MTAGRAVRGRIDKREAILRAAFDVFAREGFAAAGVDVIAAEAGVAKPTVYNHFGDKETLFREVVAAESARALAENLAVVELLRAPDPPVRDRLVEVGTRIAECYTEDRSWALRRLLHTEITRFPDLVGVVRGEVADRVGEALADQFARLSLSGALRGLDPASAAEQFTALLTGPVEGRSRMGTVVVGADELRAVAEAAVDTFLAAFGPADRSSED